jgi:sulfate adenylyltransferase subunit 1
VQWVEKFSSSADTHQGRRVFWGRIAAGSAQVGQSVTVLPSGQRAVVAHVLNHVRQAQSVHAGRSAGIVLDREVDVSRGDWLLASSTQPSHNNADEWDDTPSKPNTLGQQHITGTLAWLDDEPLVVGRVYWALHGHRWVKAKVQGIDHQVDIHTLAQQQVSQLQSNTIGQVRLALQEALPVQSYQHIRAQGALVLVDSASNRTSGALMVH